MADLGRALSLHAGGDLHRHRAGRLHRRHRLPARRGRAPRDLQRGGALMAAASPTPTPSPTPEQEAQWYVVHAYSGHEEKVKKNLEKRIESMDMQDKILQVLVPMEDEIEIKDGKRRHVQKRIFPGYILVRMVMSNDSWFVVRNTPGVTSFVGSANSPVPLQEKEVRAIQKQMKQEAPKI